MARLGSADNPARVRVRSLAREYELRDFCKKHHWHVRTCLVLDQPENIDDIKKLVRNSFLDDDQIKKAGRNEPCPCGSGKKYKKC